MRCCMQPQDFAEATFQHLAPVCASARGDALLLLTRHADVFAGRLPKDPCTRVLLPLLARAADQGVAPRSLPRSTFSLRQSSRVRLLPLLAGRLHDWVSHARHMRVCIEGSHPAVGAESMLCSQLSALSWLRLALPGAHMTRTQCVDVTGLSLQGSPGARKRC